MSGPLAVGLVLKRWKLRLSIVISVLILFPMMARLWVDRLVYFPERGLPAPPAGIEERSFFSEDGLRLHGWYAAGTTDAPTLVWSHGNAGNIAGRADIMLALRQRGLNVFSYDYRGYGKSEGRPSEPGVYLDALAAYDSERQRGVPADRIVCFGESLGGAVSIYLATRRPCTAVAVVSTFTSLRDVARQHFGPLAFLVGAQFDSLKRIGGLSVPFFAAHGVRDELVPFLLGQRLYEAAAEPKTFMRIPWAHHNDMLEREDVLDRIAAFSRAAIHGG